MSVVPPSFDSTASVKAFSTVGIVGAGDRGAALTYWCVLAGCGVILCDHQKQAIQTGVAAIREQFADSVRQGKLSGSEAHKLTGGIGITTSLEDFEICDLVIEAITEDLAMKRAVFAELSAKVDPDCVLVSTSLGWPLAEITAEVSEPQRVAGIGFKGPLRGTQISVALHQRKEGSATVLNRLRALLGRMGTVSVTR